MMWSYVLFHAMKFESGIRHSKPSGNDTYWCAILGESDYLCSLCRVRVLPKATSSDTDPNPKVGLHLKTTPVLGPCLIVASVEHQLLID